LGILDIITNAVQTDRSGSVVLEVLLRRQDNVLQGFENVGLKETILVTCWYLWWIRRRRRRTHNESVPPMFRCKMWILSIVANSARATNVQGNSEIVKWKKPEPRFIKLNVDAAYHGDQRAGSTGAVLRDFEGRFVAASNMLIPHVASAATAEAIAMKNGLLLANILGCNRIHAESDSMETIDACSGGDTWWSEAAAIFADCVDLTTAIGDVKFQHCPREANKVAHELAKVSFSNTSSCNWDDDPPSFLLPFLLDDVTIL
jgi:ribonuclease HI